MQHGEGFFRGARGRQIYHQSWLPEGQARAVLLIVHGFGEHSGRYVSIIDSFVPLGYAVHALDHVGHGRSEGTRAYVQRFTDYTDTLHTYVDMVQGWQPGIPVFMVGHSLGGLVAAYYLLDHPSGLAGAVFSGPSIAVPESITPVTLFMAKALSVLAPKAGLRAIEAVAISRGKDVVRAYEEDPLVYRGKITARLAAEMLRAQQRVAAEASAIDLPLLIVHGEEDRLVPSAGSRAFYQAVGSADKTLNVYDGLYHEVFNEPERAQVLRDVEAWLEAHL